MSEPARMMRRCRCRWCVAYDVRKCLALPAGAFGLTRVLLPMSLQSRLMLSFAILDIMFVGMTRPDNSTFRVIQLVLPASLRWATVSGGRPRRCRI